MTGNRHAGLNCLMISLILIILHFSSIVSWGDVDAIYKQGVAVYRTDPGRACTLFEQAAAEGHVGAMVGAATCYENGSGCDVDYTAAVAWYEKAVLQNSLKACEGLARIYASCPDPAFHDGGKAVKYASAVTRAKPRDSSALGLLAAAYARNMDFEMAISFQHKAIMKASDPASATECKARLESLKRIEPIPAVATSAWMVKAADAGSVWAAAEGARLLADSSSKMYDREEALRLAQLAVEAGRDDLFLLMGDICFEAEPADWSNAQEYYSEYTKRLPRRKELSTEHEIRLRYKDSLMLLPDLLISAAEAALRSGRNSDQGRELDSVDSNGYPQTDQNGNPRHEWRVKLKPPDVEGARFLYEVALRKGHPDAASALSTLDKGPSAEDRARAAELLDAAEELLNRNGNRSAGEALNIYFQSYCLDPNARHGEAAYQITVMYSRIVQMAGGGITYTDRFDWSRRAAKAGHPKAMRYWAKRYSESDGPKAEVALEYAKALLKTAPLDGDPELWAVIAMAHARNGLFEEAIEYQLKAVELANGDLHLKEKVPEFEERLSYYRNGKPYPPPIGDG